MFKYSKIMIRILFIGTFLSNKTGTKGASEKIIESLNCDGIQYLSASNKNSQLTRMLEITIKALFLKYSLVHIDTYSDRAFIITEIVTIISHLRKKRIILTLRGGKLPKFYSTSSRRFERVSRRADYKITPSLYLQDFFARQNIKLQYLPNSIDLLKFPYSRDNLKPHSLLWVRAFDRIYNPDLAVKTLYEIKKRYPDATLTMVGPDKGLLNKTKLLIDELNLSSSVQITGPVQNQLLFKYYQTHEVYLNTTSYESFGVALIEAAACGLPIISTNVGEVPYLYKHGESIMLVDSVNPMEFSSSVDELFKMPSLAEKLSRNARKIAERFDWSNIKPQWEALLSR